MGFRRRRLSLFSSRVMRIKKESMEFMMCERREDVCANLLTFYFYGMFMSWLV